MNECGRKTCGWPEVRLALNNMVDTPGRVRSSLPREVSWGSQGCDYRVKLLVARIAAKTDHHLRTVVWLVICFAARDQLRTAQLEPPCDDSGGASVRASGRKGDD